MKRKNLEAVCALCVVAIWAWAAMAIVVAQ